MTTSIDPLFQNEQIDVSSLPKAEEQHFISLEPRYKNVRYISSALFGAILLLIALAVMIFQPKFGMWRFLLIGVVAIISIWNVIYHGLSFRYMMYAVREKDITYRSGWLWRNVTTIPFNRVQHSDIRQGLLDRQFGLSRITVYTAGGQDTDLTIPGLLPDTAEKLKAFILGATEQAIENE